jgi:hypothetical protein
MTGVVIVVLIADAIALLVLVFHASPDFADYIDEHQGGGAIRDDWALDWLDRASHEPVCRRGESAS